MIVTALPFTPNVESIEPLVVCLVKAKWCVVLVSPPAINFPSPCKTIAFGITFSESASLR
jgi:hypothetical protein